MGAIIPPAVTEQGSFQDAAAQVHRILTKGVGTEHSRVRHVAVYLQQIGEHYYTVGKSEAPEDLVAVRAELEATKKARDEDGDLFAIERGHFRGENERLQEMVASLTAYKEQATEEARAHQRTINERDALRLELRSVRSQVPVKPPVAVVPQAELNPAPGDPNRCGACGWPLVTDGKGCMRGDCSQRPLPTTFYDHARYKAEVMHLAEQWAPGGESVGTEPPDTPRAPGEMPQQDGRST